MLALKLRLPFTTATGLFTRFQFHILAFKLLARILRLQRFLRRRDHHANLLEAALDAGYYDAAQLAGDARRLTGLTPTRLIAQVAD